MVFYVGESHCCVSVRRVGSSLLCGNIRLRAGDIFGSPLTKSEKSDADDFDYDEKQHAGAKSEE
jgi:hypothetical protein